MLRGFEDRLTEHDVSSGHARERAGALRRDVGRDTPPGDAVAPLIGERDGGIEMRSGDTAERQNQRDEDCARGQAVGQQGDGFVSAG